MLTAKGQQLYDYAQRIVALSEEAECRLKSQQPGGKLRIGAMESTAAARLPKALAKFHQRHPDVALELNTGSSQPLFERLLAMELDAILVADIPPDERLARLPVFQEKLLIVAPQGHPPIVCPDDIHKSTLLAFCTGCSYRARLINWFTSGGRKTGRIADLASYHAILGAAAADMGVGVVPESVLSLFPDRNIISEHPLAEEFSDVLTKLIWRRGIESANIEALVACLACHV